LSLQQNCCNKLGSKL